MERSIRQLIALCACVLAVSCAAGDDNAGPQGSGTSVAIPPTGTSMPGGGTTPTPGTGPGGSTAPTTALPGSMPTPSAGDIGGTPVEMGAAGAPGGAAGSPMLPGDGTTIPAPDGSGPGKPQCVAKPSQVVLIGDSYITWASHTLPADLAKESGQTWRNYAVGGFSMGSGGLGLIPPEWDQAVAADPDIKTAVLDGGGNDMLIPAATWPGGASCKNDANSASLPVCQMIFQTALDAAIRLMTKMADHGVRDVIYFFYPHVPNGTLLGGTAPNAILDYALPKAKEACDNATMINGGKMRCHFVDLVPVFEGHPDWFAPTDIHPNSLGSAAMAKTIWAKMKEACVGQPASSGCCEP